MTTLREHLEAIRVGAGQHPYRSEPSLDFLIKIESHAMAALAILDEAEPYQFGATRGDACRIVPDPEPSS